MESPVEIPSSNLNHIVGIENGHGYYIRGNLRMDIGSLKGRNDLITNENLCAVCGGKSNGVHFGSSSCAACNAFFRRSVVESRKYICIGSGNCRTIKDTRTSKCRACRLLICLVSGMQANAVQLQRDTVGKRSKQKRSATKPKSLNIKSIDSSPGDSTSIQLENIVTSDTLQTYQRTPSFSNSWSNIEDVPETDDLIEQGLKAYTKLGERRRLVYGYRSVEKLISGAEPQYKLWAGVDHYRLNDSMAIPTANLIEFIKSFSGFCALSTSDQVVLFKHFGAPFIIFEKYYLTYKRGGLETKRIYRQDYTYVQLDIQEDCTLSTHKHEGHFIPPDIKTADGQLVDDETLTKLATPYIIKALRLIVKPMMDLNFTDVEFIGSVLSILFDPNLPTLSQTGREQVRSLRDKLYLDWFNFYTESEDDSDGSEAALRMGNSLLIIPILNEFVSHYREFFHLLRVFGILEYDKILDDFF